MASAVVASSSSRNFTVTSWSVAVCTQLVVLVYNGFRPSARSLTVAARSPSAVALATWDAALGRPLVGTQCVQEQAFTACSHICANGPNALRRRASFSQAETAAPR